MSRENVSLKLVGQPILSFFNEKFSFSSNGELLLRERRKSCKRVKRISRNIDRLRSMNEFGGKRLETNGPYLINNDQRQILPLFRGCSFTCCIFHGLSNIGIDALASSSSAILHLPPINYASKPNHRATRLINNESRNSGEERSMESIFRNRDDEQQIRELSRVDSRRSEFSKWEHIDEFFHVITGGSEFHSEISFSNFLRISREIEIHAGHANLFVLG